MTPLVLPVMIALNRATPELDVGIPVAGSDYGLILALIAFTLTMFWRITTPLAVLAGTYRWLAVYPFDCSEQISSEMLPLIAIYRAGPVAPLTGLTTERARAEFRWEAFNAINHPNPGDPNTTLSSSTFGKITSATAPRIMQVGVKILF